MIYIKPKPSVSALEQLLWKKLPVPDREDPQIPHCSRGKRHHHGDDVCGASCVRVDGTFPTIPIVKTYGVGVFCSSPNPYRGKAVNNKHVDYAYKIGDKY